MLPHTVTLYNVERATDAETMRDTLVNRMTILRGVFLSAEHAAEGKNGKDSAELHIPFSVAAEDPLTASPRTFAAPVSYHGAAEKDALWTLEAAPACFFVKGEVIEPDLSFQEINAKYQDVYAVTAVRTCDFGAEDLRHWEVTGA